MITDSSPHSLLHRFRTANRLLPAPLTHLHIEPRVQGLSVQSFHTFPDDALIVRSQSLYELVPHAAPR